uniref:Uncharacterized protein n=1 Tax=Daucus carota subsp. sativus TaxID=79200 RepID=A0A166D391_DAUCS
MKSVVILPQIRGRKVEVSYNCIGQEKSLVLLINGNSTSEHDLVMKNDLEHLLHLLHGKGWDRPWQYLMDHSTSNRAYQAWHHELELVVHRAELERMNYENQRLGDMVDEVTTKYQLQQSSDAFSRIYAAAATESG